MRDEDRSLGLGQDITRRDFLGSTLIASGSALLAGRSPLSFAASGPRFDAWTGYGGVGDYASSNGNTRAVREAAHRIRDGQGAALLRAARATDENFDLVVAVMHRGDVA